MIWTSSMTMKISSNLKPPLISATATINDDKQRRQTTTINGDKRQMATNDDDKRQQNDGKQPQTTTIDDYKNRNLVNHMRQLEIPELNSCSFLVYVHE